MADLCGNYNNRRIHFNAPAISLGARGIQPPLRRNYVCCAVLNLFADLVTSDRE